MQSSGLQPAFDVRASRFKAGDRVRLKAEPSRRGIIDGNPTRHPSGYDYKVYFSESEVLSFGEEKLELVPAASEADFLSHKEFLRDFVLLKLRQPLTDSLYSFQASRTVFRVYQFKPALKFLNSPEQRILIADEVGLGKTIEAGIIYLEMKARMAVERVLVVCPSGLREKWHSELRSRFDDEFVVLDARGMRRFLDDYGRLGGHALLKGICSLEMLRREEFADAIAEHHVNFDLVIIDEAHHLRNAATLSHELGEILADQSGQGLCVVGCASLHGVVPGLVSGVAFDPVLFAGRAGDWQTGKRTLNAPRGACFGLG